MLLFVVLGWFVCVYLKLCIEVCIVCNVELLDGVNYGKFDLVLVWEGE